MTVTVYIFIFQGTAVTVGGEAGVKGTITVNFGLFSGTKTRDRVSNCTRDIAGKCTHKLNERTSNDNVLGTLQVYVRTS